jgi:hypothetical protein
MGWELVAILSTGKSHLTEFELTASIRAIKGYLYRHLYPAAICITDYRALLGEGESGCRWSAALIFTIVSWPTSSRVKLG